MDLIDLKEKKFLDTIFGTFTDKVNVIDVGGNKGQYSLNLLKNFRDKIEEVTIFEPVPRFFCDINKSLGKEKCIVLHNVACSSFSGEDLDFYEIQSPNDEAAEGLSSFKFRSVYENFDYEIIKVKQATLDSIVDGDKEYGLLKIDTEGHELEVLNGATNLLENSRVNYIQFEFGDCIKERGGHLSDILNFFKDYSYTVFSIDTNGDFIEINETNVEELNMVSWENYYAVKNSLKK